MFAVFVFITGRIVINKLFLVKPVPNAAPKVPLNAFAGRDKRMMGLLMGKMFERTHNTNYSRL